MSAYRLRIPVALCALLLPALAFGQAPPKSYRDAYLDGEREYNLGNLEEAEKLFTKAVKVFPGPAGPYRYLAAIAQERARETKDEASKKAFFSECLRNAQIAVAKNPKSSKAVPVRALHAECRDGLRRPRYRGKFDGSAGAIAVVTSAMGAQVKINGASYGGTPFTPRAFPSGRATVSVIYKGETKTGSLEIVPGLVSDYLVEFEEKAVVPPTGNGDPSGTGTGTGTGEPTGPVGPVDPTRTGEPSGPLIKYGWVIIKANPTDATITWNGQPAELDAQGRIKADAGVYPVTVEREGYEPWKRRVRVARGQQKVLQADLKSLEERSAQRRNGYIALGVAGALTATGAVFGIAGLSARDEATDIDSTERSRPPGAGTSSFEPIRTRDDFDDAKSRSDTFSVLAAVSFGAAAVALGTAVYFFASERSEQVAGQAAPLAVVPVSSQDGALSGAAVQYSGILDW